MSTHQIVPRASSSIVDPTQGTSQLTTMISQIIISQGQQSRAELDQVAEACQKEIDALKTQVAAMEKTVAASQKALAMSEARLAEKPRVYAAKRLAEQKVVETLYQELEQLQKMQEAVSTVFFKKVAEYSEPVFACGVRDNLQRVLGYPKLNSSETAGLNFLKRYIGLDVLKRQCNAHVLRMWGVSEPVPFKDV